MRVFSGDMMKLSRAKLPIERCVVSKDMALEVFADNQYKTSQIPDIAAQASAEGNSITLYRIGDFVDISRGPMMSHTGLLGKCTIGSLYHLPEAKSISETLYRIQGVAIPNGFHVSFILFFSILNFFNSSKN